MIVVNERKKKKLRKWIRRMGANYGQLDILVEDVKCQQANKINTRGLRAQVDYLTQYYKTKTLRNMIWHELTQLQKHGLKRQSKAVPENNILRFPRRKARKRNVATEEIKTNRKKRDSFKVGKIKLASRKNHEGRVRKKSLQD